MRSRRGSFHEDLAPWWRLNKTGAVGSVVDTRTQGVQLVSAHAGPDDLSEEMLTLHRPVRLEAIFQTQTCN